MCNAGSPDVETRTVGIELIISHIFIGAFYTFPLGDFLHTTTEIVVRLHYPPPQVAALEVPPVEEGGHSEGRRPE